MTSYMAFQIKDGDLKIVDMDSRIFSQPEMGSPSVAREAMGVSYGLKKLEGLIRSHEKRTVLFTDCSALIFLSRAGSYNSKYLEMALFISSFPNLEVVSFPGRFMVLCDLGSRLFYSYTFRKDGSKGISELFSKIYPLAPKSFDFKKLSNREIALLLLNFDRREKLDVFSRDQFKLTQNQRYVKDVSVEELDRLQRLKPELAHFISLFFGLDRDEYTEDDIIELEARLDSLPDRLKLAKGKRPNLAEVCLSLKNEPGFIRELKEAVRKRIQSSAQNEKNPITLEKGNVRHQGSTQLEGSKAEDVREKPDHSGTEDISGNHNISGVTEKTSFKDNDLQTYEHSELDKSSGIISTVCVASLASSVSCEISSNTEKESYEDNGYDREEIISFSLGQPRSSQLQTTCHLVSYPVQGSYEVSKYQNTERERIGSPSLRVSRNLLAKSQSYIPALYGAHDLNKHKYKTSLHKYEDNLFVSKSELSTFMKINDYWPVDSSTPLERET